MGTGSYKFCFFWRKSCQTISSTNCNDTDLSCAHLHMGLKLSMLTRNENFNTDKSDLLTSIKFLMGSLIYLYRSTPLPGCGKDLSAYTKKAYYRYFITFLEDDRLNTWLTNTIKCYISGAICNRYFTFDAYYRRKALMTEYQNLDLTNRPTF